MAVAAPGGGADRDEHGLGVADRLLQVDGEGQAAFAHVLGDEFGQARLEDRDLAAVERLDLGRILVDAADVVAEIRKAGAGNQSDIACSDHRDTHRELPVNSSLRFRVVSVWPQAAGCYDKEQGFSRF